jgi:cytochrome c peroxidase
MRGTVVPLVIASCLACNASARSSDGSRGPDQTSVSARAEHGPHHQSSHTEEIAQAAPRVGGGSATPPGPPPSQTAFYAAFAHPPPTAVLTALGRKLFFDPGLSASGKLACASCHDPGHAMAPGNVRAIQLGGADGRQRGFRAAPGLRYLVAIQGFVEHYIEDETGADQGPTGGFMWDGRAATVHDQARLPLFAPSEMANDSPAELARKLRRAPYARELRDAFGDAALEADEAAVNAAVLALEVFQQDQAMFYPYDSKYDAVLRGRAQLTAREARGLALFNDPAKGNCASCHPSTSNEHGFPAFSDFGFVALGVPRARQIPANADPAFYDLGLCGPLRRDLADHPEYCGLFRTPSLRNVAVRRRLFHNGSFTSLTQAVRFYATRDVAPELWYPRDPAGHVAKFDDLPEPYRKNVNMDPPFGGHPGQRPALDDAEIADIVAFLGTLTDGYRPEPALARQ